MNDPAVSTLVREVLAEELARIRDRNEAGLPTALGAASVREERVAIANDADLQAFAKRIVFMAADSEAGRDIADGKLIFRLDSATGSASPQARFWGHKGRIERGLLSERQVDQLPGDTKVVVLGKQVRMTPLARDRLRQRGISIERMEQ
jgi:hypothetical protein